MTTKDLYSTDDYQESWVIGLKVRWWLFQRDIQAIPDRLAKHVAWWLPRRIVMWCLFRAVAHASQGKWSSETVVGASWETIYARWEERSTDRHC